MLSEVIAHARALGIAVQQMPVPPGAEEARGWVSRFLDQGLGSVESSRGRALAFAGASQTVLQRLAQALQNGTSPNDLLPDLRALAGQATQARDELTTLAQPVTQLRDGLGQEVAKLNSYDVQLRARLAGLKADHDRLAQEASEISHRLEIINTVSIFFPIVKLADTIASLIQSKTTTEGQLSNVNNELGAANAEANQLNGFIQQVAMLSTSVGQLANSAQNLTNTVNIIASQVGNESAFAGSASAESAKLFITALQQIVTAMQQDAS